MPIAPGTASHVLGLWRMSGQFSLLMLMGLLALPATAQVCGGNDIHGAYGVQLSGTVSIGVNGPQPMASISRLVFDGQGGIAGVSSADMAGYFLGNPVTGSYTFKTNCSLSFELQDDSGAWQHFAGLAKEGGSMVQIHQTDPDTGEPGIMVRTPAACRTAGLHGDYSLALSGAASQFATNRTPGAAFSIEGTVSADGAGNLLFNSPAGKTTGSYELDSDCVVEIELGVPQDDSADLLKLRGVLVDQGNLLLAVESDPAGIAAGRFTRLPSGTNTGNVTNPTAK